MANEIQTIYASTRTLYFIVHNAVGQVWSTLANSFGTWSDGSYANYTVSLTEQGTAGYYAGNFPSAIVPGTYNITAYNQVGGSPSISADSKVGVGQFEWDGAAQVPLSNLATSGQLGQYLPVKLSRGWMVPNFGFYLVSSLDHVTPFTSGVCSGQIARDGGSFGALQSGLCVERGLGWYDVPLTSGDLLANAVKLNFTANGVSGGSSDPRPIGILLQRTSGGA